MKVVCPFFYAHELAEDLVLMALLYPFRNQLVEKWALPLS